MKKWLFALPLAATALAIACNLKGFWTGGPRAWWEMAVTAGYLLVWAGFLPRCRVRWQRNAARVWWIATAVCAAAGFAVVTFGLDGFWLALPAMALITPLSGVAFLTGPNYPLCYGLCAALAVVYAAVALKKHSE